MEHKEALFHYEDCQAQEQVAQRDYADSFLGGLQNQTE